MVGMCYPCLRNKILSTFSLPGTLLTMPEVHSFVRLFTHSFFLSFLLSAIAINYLLGLSIIPMIFFVLFYTFFSYLYY